MDHQFSKHFCGATTIGEKGQVVIPAEIRKLMRLKTGEKLLVFVMGPNMVTLAKTSQLEKMAQHLSTKLKDIQNMLKENS